ncbi:MAG: hypothetical protein ACE5HP_03850 [Gemmatimonadota bacterium]
MVTIMALWLPILLSAAIVFVASSVIHMLLRYHHSDFGKVPEEDRVLGALREAGVPPGDYVIPCPGGPEGRKDPEFLAKVEQGPMAFLTLMPGGQLSMGKNLVQWFLYCVVVGVFGAYIAGRALEPGAEYLAVFRFVGCTTFIGYALALWQNSIWYRRAWSTTLKSTFDGLVYALLSAGTFGWLWPG